MGIKKKLYHFDKPQYRDAHNNILFFTGQAKLDYHSTVFLFEDCYGKVFVFSRLENSELDTSVDVIKDSWLKIIQGFNIYHGFQKGKNPKSYPVSLRTQAINLCISLGYKSIHSENRPTLLSLADIFNISQNSLQNNSKRYEKMLISDEKRRSEQSLLVNFVSQYILG